MKIYKIAQSINYIVLYRGISRERANLLKVGDYLPVTQFGNQLSKNLETAKIYASKFNDVEDGVVLELKLDADCVLADSLYKEDYSIIKPCKIYGINIVS